MTTAAICATREVSWSPSLYRGELYDSDLNLYYLRARYYNPTTGRFLSRDPEDGYVLVPITLHKYLYAGGNPVNRLDPRGRAIIEDTILDEQPFGKVAFLNAVSCVVGIGTAAASLELDRLGLGFAVYGCVATVWSPAGPALQMLKTGLDLGSCAYAASMAAGSITAYVDSQNPDKEYQAVLDSLGGVVGCAVTGMLAGLDGD